MKITLHCDVEKCYNPDRCIYEAPNGKVIICNRLKFRRKTEVIECQE
jgi:hypothetical protein